MAALTWAEEDRHWNTGIKCFECEGMLEAHVVAYQTRKKDFRSHHTIYYGFCCTLCDVEGRWFELAMRQKRAPWT